jgi:hypothetical protein
LKVIGLFAWYGFCWLVWRVALRLLADRERERAARVWAALAAFVAATFAGSVYNANVGMENGLFATVIWSWIALALRWGSFEPADPSPRRELVLSLILGIAGWLRPEAVAVALMAFACRVGRSRSRATLLTSLFVTLIVAGLAFVFEWARTGDIVPTSILSRRILAMPTTLSLGPLAVDPTFAKRLIIYLPLTGLFFVGAGAREHASSPRVRALKRFLTALFACFFGLYTFAGTPHLARYLIFLIPILVIGAAAGARRLWCAGTRSARAIVVFAALAIAILATVEPFRRADLYPPGQLASAISAPALRKRHTDELLRVLGAPMEGHLVVGLESVQIRYELDDRITVRSLDGRVDPMLLRFVGRDAVDHVGYLLARHVDVLLAAPSYNRDQSSWSLAMLRQLPTGQALEHDGLLFRRIAGKGAFVLTAR